MSVDPSQEDEAAVPSGGIAIIGMAGRGKTAERPDAEYHDERRRYYRVTPFGREAAMAEAERLSQLVSRAQAIGWLPKQV